MSFHRWLRNLRSPLTSLPGQRLQERRESHRAATLRPNLETLEGRALPALVDTGSHLLGQMYATAMVTGDFNGDGKLDIATANRGLSSTVSVQMGNGDGTFQPAVSSATGQFPNSLAVGDFNSDGKLDVATANVNNTVSVLLGKGDGTFQGIATYWTDYGPSSIAVGDFNGDGKLDLGVASNLDVIDWTDDNGESYGHWVCGADVLLGNGDGSFPALSSVYFGDGYIVSTTMADLNADGFDDFAMIGTGSGTELTLVYGDSSGDMAGGGFPISDSLDPSSIAAADVNADGHIDLVTADRFEGIRMPLSGSSAVVDPTIDTTSVVLADFTGDGILDIATLNSNSNTVGVLHGNGDDTFSAPEYFAASPNLSFLVAGDFNGDGRLDAVTLSNNPVRSGYANYVNVMINDGSWSSTSLPHVSINDATMTEGNTGNVNATFTLSLTAASSQPITLHYATADGTATTGSDYSTASGDVTFAPGQTSKTITVAVLGDRIAEPNESFAVNLTGATNAIIADGQGIGTILDNDPHFTITDATVSEGNTGTRPITFNVNLSMAYDLPVTLSYATANGNATAGSDYQAKSGMLTIPVGQTSGTITVQVNGDRLAEPNETFVVNLSNLNYGALSDGQGQGTIVDDEPRISISDVTKAEGKKGQTTQFTFTATLSTGYDQAVTLSFRTVDGTATTGDSDYSAQTGAITFKPGETTKTITIEVKGDSKNEANESFCLDLFDNSTNSLFTKNRGIGTILNDD